MSRAWKLTDFESTDGSRRLVFSRYSHEWESRQQLRTVEAAALGADYAVDLLGTLPAPKGVGEERVRFLLVGDGPAALADALDQLRSTAYGIGTGRLWQERADGLKRWAWARLSNMPEITLGGVHRRHAPVALRFTRLSDWFAADETVVTVRTSTATTSIPLTNPGATVARGITFELRSHGAGGFNQPSLTNDLTAETWQSTRVAANANALLRVDAGRMAVEYSTNLGGTWTDDYANFSTGPLQVGFLRLVPGGQSLTLTGAPNATLTVRFYPSWD